MKRDRFIVHFVLGPSETVWASSRNDAIILGLAARIQKGKNGMVYEVEEKTGKRYRIKVKIETL